MLCTSNKPRVTVGRLEVSRMSVINKLDKIETFRRIAEDYKDGSHYFILLIITNGSISDKDNTVKAIVNVNIFTSEFSSNLYFSRNHCVIGIVFTRVHYNRGCWWKRFYWYTVDVIDNFVVLCQTVFLFISHEGVRF